MSFSVIIPSKDAANLTECLSAIHRQEPALLHGRIIVVNDGLERLPVGAMTIGGIKPFVFSRNVNLGIAAAGGDDVILLNDDALLETPGGFSALAAAAADHPEYGIISATTNCAGNVNMYPKNVGLREEPRMVCFICAYIPRATIERVGYMDERFGGIEKETNQEIYGFCDDDMCLRIRREGLRIGIFDGCTVDHKTLQSSFRSHGPRSLAPGLRAFVAKWGSHPL